MERKVILVFKGLLDREDHLVNAVKREIWVRWASLEKMARKAIPETLVNLA